MNTPRKPDPPVPAGERAILVCLEIGRGGAPDRAEEASSLVESAGGVVCQVLAGHRDRPDSATFAGSGKVEEIKAACRLHNARDVVFDHVLTAVQVRNLEKALSEGGPAVRVYDRTELILEIFAQRARSHEGKLQVELARRQSPGIASLS